MGLKKAMEYGKELKVILILDSGKTAKPMASEYMLGKMAIDTKENGNPA